MTNQTNWVSVVNSSAFPQDLFNYKNDDSVRIGPKVMARIEEEFTIKPNPDFNENDADSKEFISSLPRGVHAFTNEMFVGAPTVQEAEAEFEEELLTKPDVEENNIEPISEDDIGSESDEKVGNSSPLDDVSTPPDDAQNHVE